MLRSEIAHHDRLYFEENAPIISDFAYDQLKQELQELEAIQSDSVAEHSADPVSPESRTPMPPTGRTHRHGAPMLSLNKAYRESDWDRFHWRAATRLSPETPTYVIEPKYDGIAVSLTYRNGNLSHAATRGDGRTGRDITPHVRFVSNIPLSLASRAGSEPLPELIELRGEIFVPLPQFHTLNAERALEGRDPFSSPRNLAAGAMLRADPAAVAEVPLEIVLFGIGRCEPAHVRPETHLALLTTLSRWGVPIPSSWVCQSPEEAWRTIQQLGLDRSEWEFPNDGVVVKVSAAAHQQKLGDDREAPRWAIAFKFAPPRATTVLREVEPQVGRTGAITPVAVFDPVQVGGATVRRASLHNYRRMELMDLHSGDSIVVERAGEVVPRIAEVLDQRRSPQAAKLAPPVVCPSCGTTVVTEGALVRCPLNQCPEQIRRRIEHFVGPDSMDLPGLGPATIDALVRHGILGNISDLFTLSDAALPQLAAAGIQDPGQLLAEIETCRTAPVWRYLVGMSIPGVGPANARKMVRHFETLEAIAGAGEPELRQAGIAPSAAREIAAFLQTPAPQSTFQALHQARVRPGGTIVSGAPPVLQGLVIVFSGSLQSLSRADAEALVEQAGGTTRSSVSNQTTHLVIGSNPGRKLAEARQRGVTIIDEGSFLQMLAPSRTTSRSDQ